VSHHGKCMWAGPTQKNKKIKIKVRQFGQYLFIFI
jgi:hypothetical protein